MNKLLQFFTPKSKLSDEAFLAYFNKLPDSIEVSWFRSDGFIVGKVVAGENEFMTQGKNPRDFIDMVNDGVVMVNRIPESYRGAISRAHSYSPPREAIDQLKITNRLR
jgi:hypothetical protein